MERFVYHYVDFSTMEAKTVSRKYKYLEQFYADARTILHNVFVCFGGELDSLLKMSTNVPAVSYAFFHDFGPN